MGPWPRMPPHPWTLCGRAAEGHRGGWPKAWGGGDTLARGSRGASPYYSLGSPPGMAPLILGVSLVIRYRFLPIFRTFLGDLVGILVIRRVLLRPRSQVTSGRYTFVHPDSTDPCTIATSTTTTKQSLPIKSEESVKIGKHQPTNRPRSILADVTSVSADTPWWLRCAAPPQLITSLRWGVWHISPPCSLGNPPQMAPLILGVSLVVRYRFLPIFRTFLGDFTPDRLDSRRL